MDVLGLDISSANTGWALVSDGKLKSYGALPIHLYKNKSKIDNHMLHRYAKELKALIINKAPDIVAVESIYVGPNDRTAILLAMMSGIARAIGFGLTKKELVTIYPTQVNKFLKIGNPKRAQRKGMVVRGMNAIFKLKLLVKEDDIADAIGISYLAYLNLTGTGKVTNI